MHKKAILYSLIFISIIIFLASGCNKQKEPPKKSDLAAKRITPQPKKIAKPSAPTPAPQPVKDQQAPDVKGEEKAVESGSEFAGLYNPIGKIDPFAPLFQQDQVVTVAKTAERRKRERRGGHLTPLEKVDLSQMKLLGIILAPSGNRALVSETSGKGYVVTVGTYMGIASGRVVEILKDRVIVEEEVENILGKISLRKRELKLQKPPGEE